MQPLSELLEKKRTLIVVGPGGVGKTTTSAAFAVQAARMGLKVLVLTVDPARRLAQSLGLEELGNVEVEIDPALFEAAGASVVPGGRLFGMMLDTKSTFDGVVNRYAPNDAVRDSIFSNPFYEQASTALAGSQEYMAMEKLYEIREQRDYDLIVLDTPPTPNALDFLSAPDRLEDFFDSDGTKMLLKGMKAASKLGFGFLKVNTFVMKRINKFVGMETFIGLMEFIQAFRDMYGGFKERAGHVRRILRSDDVAFVIVTSTDQTSIAESSFFYEQLDAQKMPFGGVVVNRVRKSYLTVEQLDGLQAHLMSYQGKLEGVDPALAADALETTAVACTAYQTLSQVDQERLVQIRERFSEHADRIYPVQLFEEDIHDIGGLAMFAERVVAVGDSNSSSVVELP
ncbi:MAG: anion-transporting ArsA/GET3 family ATPase [Myxococcota bacterium]